MDETRCLTTQDALTDTWQQWTVARSTGDYAAEAILLDTLEWLFDRVAFRPLSVIDPELDQHLRVNWR